MRMAIARPTLTAAPRGLAAHVSNYTLGNALVTLAALVSFPILTRLLTVEEYGVMNLVATALALMVALGKLGMQHAALRFHAEVRVQDGDAGLLRHASTVLFGMGAVGLAATLLWALVSQWLPADWWSDSRVAPLFLFTAVLILVRVLESAFVNPLRAEERSGVLNVYFVVRRWAGLALLLGVLIAVQRDLWGFYAATIVSEVLALMFLAWWCLVRQPVAVAAFSPPMFRAMVVFGLPMLAVELSSVVLSMGDRYLIQHLVGAEALGVYVAAYNLCDYLRAALLAALVAAAQPAYLRVWAEQGAAATALFLRRFVHVYLMVAAWLVAGVSAVGAELLHLLASAKYAGGAVIIPWAMTGLAFDTLVLVLGAGLYLQKRTLTVAALVVVCAVFNIGLNALLIPLFGIVGAGIATMLGYGSLLLLCALAGRRAVETGLPAASAVKFIAFGLVMYVAVSMLETPSEVTTLVVRALAGTALYLGLVLLFDATGRDWLLDRAQAVWAWWVNRRSRRDGVSAAPPGDAP
jgi:O-antigen/teichoic acid export membrane protein